MLQPQINVLVLEISNLIESELDKMISDPDSSFSNHIKNDIDAAAFIAEYNISRRLLKDVATHPSTTESMIRSCVKAYDYKSYIRRIRIFLD